jgi:hypothetical protein
LRSVTVHPENEKYIVEKSTVYNADKTKIVYYPAALGGEYTVAAGVSAIGNYAFSDCPLLTDVTIKGAIKIGDSAFATRDDELRNKRLSNLYLPKNNFCALGNAVFDNINGYTKSPENIYVPEKYLEQYIKDWGTAYQNAFRTYTTTLEEPENNIMLINSGAIYKLETFGFSNPTIKINTSNSNISIKQAEFINGNQLIFSVVSGELEGKTTINISLTEDDKIEEVSFEITVFKEILESSYELINLTNEYQFINVADNTYESTNKNVEPSYTVCQLNIDSQIEDELILTISQGGDKDLDIGYISNLNQELGLNNKREDSAYASVSNSGTDSGSSSED